MRRLFCIFLMLLLLCGCGANPAETQAPTEPIGEMKVHFIDVGQGDCTLVECNGQYMLIDAGESTAGDKIVKYLKDLGVEKLDIVVSTHPHTDHMNGYKIVLPEFDIGTVYTSYLTSKEPFYINFKNVLQEKRITPIVASAGTSFTLGNANISVIGPVTNCGTANDDSLVLMIQFGNSRFLLAADMETMSENNLVSSGTDITADVLRVGHHGSGTSSSTAFLNAVKPSYAVVSTGEKKPPADAVLLRLQQQNAAVFRTDTMGTIVATTDGVTITIAKEK